MRIKTAGLTLPEVKKIKGKVGASGEESFVLMNNG